MPRVKLELTEAEIAERAAKIRANWSEREHRKRAGVIEQPWTPPAVTPVELNDEPSGWLYAVGVC